MVGDPPVALLCDQTACNKAVATENRSEPTSRKFRVCVAAGLDLERRCFLQLGVLLSQPVLWELLPATALTVSHQCLCFRIISRTGCCVQQLLVKDHSGFFTKLFRLLDSMDNLIEG